MSARAARPVTATPAHRDERDEALAANLKRSGWRIGLIALGIYLGFIAWNFLRSQLGG
jgi:hypothetical protein